MTVAYLVMSHRAPAQVLRLARTLRAGSPGAPIVIHHDPRGEPLDRAALDGLGGIGWVDPARAVDWGRWSQLVALLGSLRWALERTAFDWLVLLSGQDYPVRPLAHLESDLLAGGWDGHIQGDVVPAPGWRGRHVGEFTGRYFYRHRPVRPLAPPVRRALSALRPLVIVRDMPWGASLGRRVPTPFGPGLPCRRGQDWLSLSRRCVEILCEDARRRPELLDHYRTVPLPTESYPQTVLHSQAGLRLSEDPRRFSLWRPGARHPEVLGPEHLEEILASDTDFARKLDLERGPELFEALDEVVLREVEP